MIKEKSCGAVIIDNSKKILVIKHNDGHWSFPKGHVENNETEIMTALREIKEETNLDVSINENIRETETYSPYKGCMKDVIFFLATPISNKVILQTSEVSSYIWLNYKECLELITYESDKSILKKIYKKYLEL